MLLSAEVNRNFWIPDLVKDSMFRVAFIVNTTIYVTYTEHCICYNVSGLYAENKRVKKRHNNKSTGHNIKWQMQS